MKGAIATVEIFATRPGASEKARRLTLVVAAPEREPAGDAWSCRVALADLHAARAVTGRDSLEALSGALDQARLWLDGLREEGFGLTRDRAGEVPFELD